ncbi:ureidoglycolate lyase [Nitratireductor basaltis]|uniref:Ureidoglycolate lyase n=1 Tax=Nitratireductor basaltis TaxID=472175 RepID=A0A084U7Y7_9HYPH|nr:ureidoglycolate lyase [Nitratireductor basaltis]KFB09073.1 Ureidoglycolate lyase [Nitratireductor basaltis]
MSARLIKAQPLTREAFAPFGDVIQTEGAENFLINAGKTRRFHDLAKVETCGENARVLINIFRGEAHELPLPLKLVERHPLGSQAFFPLAGRRFIVIVCPDEGGKPGMPHAFLASGKQGVNYHVGTWHGVLTAIDQDQDFLVVDRGGDGNNLEEYRFGDECSITL